MFIIDTHCHAGINWFEPIELLEFQMERNGVDAAVLIQHKGNYDNRYLLQQLSPLSDRFRVVVSINPDTDDPMKELERLQKDGASGVRLSPVQTFRNCDKTALWKHAGELGLVVSSGGNLTNFASSQFRNLIDSCHETRIVLEHLAGVGMLPPPYINFEEALRNGDNPNIFIKVPGLGEICERPSRLDTLDNFTNVPPFFEMAKEAFGVTRMMWGSDFPPSANREGYSKTLTGVQNHPAFISRDDVQWILGRSAAKVFNFDRFPL